MHFAWNVVCDSDDRVEMVIESIFYFIMKIHVSPFKWLGYEIFS